MNRKIYRVVLLRWFQLGITLALHFGLQLTSISAFAQSAESLLNRDIMAGAKTMAKEVRIYHYFNLKQVWDELKTSQGRNAYTNRYIEHVTNKFWDLGFHADAYINAGPGVYLAIDPHVSQSFGNTMIELRIPKGARYINVVRAIPVAKDTIDALVAEGVIARHQAGTIFSKATGPTRLGFYRDTLKTMTDSGFEKFRSLVQRVLIANHIQFIEFNWKTSLPGFCANTSFSSFNYIGSTPYNGMYRNVLMASTLPLPGLTAEEQEFSARITKFRDVLEKIESYKARGMKVPKDFALGFYSPAEYKQIKDSTFSCP